jgi:uncharacterized protein (DUF488 family)
MNQLFTIGHSTHPIEEFLGLLKRHQIDVVADVRSQPYSRHFPWFCSDAMKILLHENGIQYVFLGKEFGARRDEPECYIGRAVDYDMIAKTPAFAAGLDRLRKGLEKYRIALMCAEKDPLDCHRTILVSRHAFKFAEVRHILGDGGLEDHTDAEARLLQKFKREPDELFASPEEILEQAYVRRGREIAYIRPEPNS